MHESKMHAVNSFVTLTYNDDHYGPSLVYSDFQKFLKRLRRSRDPSRIRFFVAGEYGDQTQRRHFHALLFNCGFSDLTPVKDRLYRSKELEELWPFGFSSVGEVTYESAAYVASYCVKKVNGRRADSHYLRVDSDSGELVHIAPEFGHMSLKPGIGYAFFQKYWPEMYHARDGVVLVGGNKVPCPRYYDALLEASSPDFKEWRDYTRYVESGKFAADCTPERLAVREHVARAAHNFKRRVSI